MSTVTVETPVCPACGQTTTLQIDEEGYRRWALEGWLIQKALPMLDTDTRELLLSGYHPDCWDKTFGDLEA